MHEVRQELLLGNEAIGRGLVEAGCHFVTSYPGTPSSEILPSVIRYKKEESLSTFVHWAINEKVAFDEALAASYTGKRAAVAMKQVGLNVAADSLMSAAYTGVRGGFIVISADDPGPHSSQTEQDSRLFALFAKIPVFDPESPVEAIKMIPIAFEISEKYEIPVMLRPSLRVCHSRMLVPISPIARVERKAEFKKDPKRWAATPVHRYRLHRLLNEKLRGIEEDFAQMKEVNYCTRHGSKSGIIAAGISFATVIDVAADLDLPDRPDILKIGTPYPLPHKLVDEFIQSHEKILVLEDPDVAIELQIGNRSKVSGRLNGCVPGEGELTPDVVCRILGSVRRDGGETPAAWHKAVESLEKEIEGKRPTLCCGCGHRAAFFAIRKALPKAIFTSDIGCYTLGLNLKAVDTVLDMGAGLTIATGFFHSYRQDGSFPPIVATMGDSTFFHSGIPGLIDAVYSGARYVFVLLDNAVAAMTGMQPTPDSGILADGSKGGRVDLIQLIQGCGVKFVEVVDPYRIEDMIHLVKKAQEYTKKEDGGMAVIVARHPCNMYRPSPRQGKVEVGDLCDGCRFCLLYFECPALRYEDEKKAVTIDRALCVNCGVCIEVCPRGAISRTEENR